MKIHTRVWFGDTLPKETRNAIELKATQLAIITLQSGHELNYGQVWCSDGNIYLGTHYGVEIKKTSSGVITITVICKI